MIKLKKTFSHRLKDALDIRQLKQSDLVEKTGIGKSAISQYLSGKYEAKQTNIYKIASALNVSEAWLMGYDVPIERKEQPNTPQPSTPHLNTATQELVAIFQSLNDEGQTKVLEYARDISETKKYTLNYINKETG